MTTKARYDAVMEMKVTDMLGAPAPSISKNVKWLLDNHFHPVDDDGERNGKDEMKFTRRLFYGEDCFDVWAYVSEVDGECSVFAGYYSGRHVKEAGSVLKNSEFLQLCGYDDEPTFLSRDVEEAVKNAVAHGINTIDRFLEHLRKHEHGR